MDIEELPAWKRILFIYALFMMMLMFLLGAINNAWKCYKSAGKLIDTPMSSSEEKKSLLSDKHGNSIQSYDPIVKKKYVDDI